MYWSGPIVGAFIAYHLMQFTFGVGGTAYHEFDAYGNVIEGFRVPAVSIFYILAMAMLCLHLRHGLWSMFQTLGFYHPRHTPRIRRLASAVAMFVFSGLSAHPHRRHAADYSASPLNAITGTFHRTESARNRNSYSRFENSHRAHRKDVGQDPLK